MVLRVSIKCFLMASMGFHGAFLCFSVSMGLF